MLAGVSKVDVHDPAPTSYADLSSSFLLSEQDVGIARAQNAAERLAPLNPYVRVGRVDGPFTRPEDLAGYAAVVAIDRPMGELRALNAVARAAGCRLICVDARGVFGRVFCDFGDEFVVDDPDGEEPKQVQRPREVETSGVETLCASTQLARPYM